jgi:hypothetical protein
MFAAPAETGLVGERDLHDRRAVGECPVTERPDLGRDAIGEALEPEPQHLVVIAAERIA